MRLLLFCLPLLLACGSKPELQVVKDRDGHLRAEVTRLNGRKDGPVRIYHADGTLETEGRYARDSRHGPWTTVSHEHDTLSIVIFRYGRKHGVQRYWAPNGQLLREEWFKDGVPHGPLHRFFADGSPRQRATYRKGLLNGEYTEWFKVDSTSVGLIIGRYKDGVREGRWTWFFANGNPKQQGRYEHGKQVGLWRTWDPGGRLKGSVMRGGATSP